MVIPVVGCGYALFIQDYVSESKTTDYINSLFEKHINFFVCFLLGCRGKFFYVGGERGKKTSHSHSVAITE